MADIDVVKKSSNTWLWIIVALIVIALIAWFARSRANTVQTGMLLDDGVKATHAVVMVYHT